MRIKILSLFFVLFCASIFAGNAEAVTYDIVTYFPITDTDTWIYNGGGTNYINGTRLINGATTMRYHYPDNSEEYYTCNSSGLRMYGLAGYSDGNWVEFIYNSPLTVAPQYVQIGQTYTGSTTFSYAGYTFNVNSSLIISCLDDVTVNSGAVFKNAVKAIWALTITCPSLGYYNSVAQELWMSANIGTIKQYIRFSGPTQLIQIGITHYPSLRKKAELFSSANSEGYIYFEYLDENFNGGLGRISKKQKTNASYILLQYWGASGTIRVLEKYTLYDILTERIEYYESGRMKSSALSTPDSEGNVLFEYTDEDYLAGGYGKLIKKTKADGSYSTYSDYYAGTRQYGTENKFDSTGKLTTVFQYYQSGKTKIITIPGYGSFEIIAITDNNYDDWGPQVNSAGDVVWKDSSNINLYNGVHINKFPYGSGMVKINDTGQVVWSNYYGSSDEIYFFNGSDIVRLTNNTYTDDEPDISADGYITWRGQYDYWGADFETFLYDGTSIKQLTNNSYDDQKQRINLKNHVVWEGKINGYNNIFLYDGTTTRQLTNNAYEQNFPKINRNDYIVWEGNPSGSGSEIFLYNGSTVSRLTNNTYFDYDPQLSDNGNVVWEAHTPRGSNIAFFDGSTTKMLMNNYEDHRDPQISGNNIVWNKWEAGHDLEVCFYNGDSIIQLTDNNYNDYYPNICGDNIVWSAWDGNDTEIILAKKIAEGFPIVAADLNASGQQDVVIDFGLHYGIWVRYNDSTWIQLHTISPRSIIAGNLDSDPKKDLIIDFAPPYSIWIYYNNSTWQQLHSVSAEQIITADLDNNGQDDIVVDFGSTYGIWIYYNNSAWQQLHGVSSVSMTAGNLDSDPKKDLIIDFGSQYGIWIYYNNSTWTQLHGISAESITATDLDNNGQDDIVVDFGSTYGIWIYYNNSTWTQLHGISPKSITSGNLDSDPKKDLIVDFGPQYGIWIYYNNSTWTQLHNVSADFIATGDMNGNSQDDVIVDFGPQYGIWVWYDNDSWAQLHTVSP